MKYRSRTEIVSIILDAAHEETTKIQMVKEEMDDKFNKIISMIQQNPILANVKVDILKSNQNI